MEQTSTRSAAPDGVTAFCGERLELAYVQAVLKPLGLRLIKTILPGGIGKQRTPPQYHFEADNGMQLILLVGKELHPCRGRPRRQTSQTYRLWLYPGANHQDYLSVQAFLACKWSLTWKPDVIEDQSELPVSA